MQQSPHFLWVLQIRVCLYPGSVILSDLKPSAQIAYHYDYVFVFSPGCQNCIQHIICNLTSSTTCTMESTPCSPPPKTHTHTHTEAGGGALVLLLSIANVLHGCSKNSLAYMRYAVRENAKSCILGQVSAGI